MRKITTTCELTMNFPDDMDLDTALEYLLLHIDMDLDVKVMSYDETTDPSQRV